MRRLAAYLLVIKYLSNQNKIIDSNRTPQVETQFDYNLDNVLKKKTYTDGKFVEYTPDKMGLVTKFKNSRNIEKNYSFDPNHNLLSISYSDTTPSVTFTYDDYNRPLTVIDGTGTTTYGFNANNRLISVDGPWANDTITYQYGGVRLLYVDIEEMAVDSSGQNKKAISIQHSAFSLGQG